MMRLLLLFISVVSISTLHAQKFDMKKELARLAVRDTFPDNFGFTNSHALTVYRRLIKNETINARKNQLYYEMTWQYIFAGYPDSAIWSMKRIPDVIWENARKSNPEFDREFISGLAYLRVGEQNNCQFYHNAYSCIMPLSEEAFHRDTRGSKLAVNYFRNVLDRSPDHYTARWLLNVAYMTLGAYPSGVPEEYLIDFNKWPQDNTVPYFKNWGSDLGVDTKTFYGGSITEDFNNDGYMDIFATSGDLLTNVELYMADGKGGYHRHTSHANLDGITGGGNCTHGDYNNDGYEDIYIIRGGWLGKKAGKLHPNSLLRNNGDGTFTDVTMETGLLDYFPSHTAGFADYNQDGWLDLFVGNEDGYSQLFMNDEGVFKEVSTRAGIFVNTMVKGSMWGDYDNDGLIDLYVSVAGGNNYLFKNQGPNAKGDYIFKDMAGYANVQKPWHSFPTFFADVNNDGWLDIFCASYPSDMARLSHQYIIDTANIEFSKLYLNQKNGTFRDVAEEYNLHRSIEAMGLNYGDIDNDGWLDFYVGTGFPSFEALIPNLMMRNNEGKEFLEVMNSGFSHLQKGHGIGFADMDNDGDQDVYVSLGGFMEADMFWNMLLENPGNDNNWITIDLEGVESNRSAIGSTVTVRALEKDGTVRTFYRQVNPGGSFGSSSLQLEIGLGTCTEIEVVSVVWPNDMQQEFPKVKINTTYKLKEGGSLKVKKIKPFKFKAPENGGHHHHH